MRFFVFLLSCALAATAPGIRSATAQGTALPDSSAAADSSATPPAAPESAAETVPASEAPVAAPPGNASISNPATSVIGWFQAAAGNDRRTQENAFDLREAELALQSAVDPVRQGRLHPVVQQRKASTWRRAT